MCGGMVSPGAPQDVTIRGIALIFPVSPGTGQYDTFPCVTRRSAEVRLDSLLRTACDVIVDRGLANTRTADVASAAGVSQALVFYHFSSKERLLAQAFSYAAEQDLGRLDAVLSSEASPLQK